MTKSEKNAEKKTETAASFETIISRIEQAATTLENGDLPLADALKIFETASVDLTAAKKILAQAEEKIKVLAVNSDGENALTEP